MNELKFSPGRIIVTPGAVDLFRACYPLESSRRIILDYVRRHVSGDWGDIGAEDAAANDRAVNDGGRILSSYPFPDDRKIWIITEVNRTITTVLLPEDY